MLLSHAAIAQARAKPQQSVSGFFFGVRDRMEKAKASGAGFSAFFFPSLLLS